MSLNKNKNVLLRKALFHQEGEERSSFTDRIYACCGSVYMGVRCERIADNFWSPSVSSEGCFIGFKICTIL
eukprot:scaffold2563_cov124-Cylindrotheca_fusiformis.AAC.9